ncbi:pilus assembly protein TadG-related protein [Cupriavidus sp. UYPR2.512]|uniref:pilus assembly protein TadG-related protein n=1 Tax=Cupriavidus sp. UYPR2.512 TaxID=1080187 RepID=UPI00037FC4DB|nr:pilus assembly protein TadG-related protein [Cupriavidus sp. UYPR2.512]UIF86847.1 Tad domain-containing protein [Cupriavidus necator]
MSRYNKKSERGVILPIVGLTLAVLLGMAGLVIDLGAMFVAKTELQSAVDSCALAAAQELDGTADALTRATSAGLTAGNANKVKYQNSSAAIVDTDVTFSDTLSGSYSSSFTPVANARYAKCNHATSGIAAYLIQMVGGPTSTAVTAVGVATRTHAQSTCPIPVALLPKTGASAPDYGFTAGDWVTVLYDGTKTASPGEMGWYNLDGSTNANETKQEMAVGYCNSKVNDTVGTPGAKVAVDDQWNSRFGIYKNNGDKSVMRPDFTGYAYTSKNWPNGKQAYSGSSGGTDPAATNFKSKRLTYASYADTGTSVAAGDAITDLNMLGGYKDLATPGGTGDHAKLGMSRRLVIVPVVSAASKVVDFACMLMLQPIGGPTDTVQFEYLGNAATISSPCTTNGLAGGNFGPMIPALVQ